jgi:hypothetical protein
MARMKKNTKGQFSLNNLPFESETLTKAINTLLQTNTNELIEEHINNETHQTFNFITAQASVSSYRKSDNSPVENRIVYLSALPQSVLEVRLMKKR